MKNNNQYSTGFLNLPATKTQSMTFVQVIIFSQSLLCAAVFWLITQSFEGAIYGFMLGTLSTIVAVYLQCHKSEYLNRNFIAFFPRRLNGKTLFFLVKPAMAIVIFLAYSTTITH